MHVHSAARLLGLSSSLFRWPGWALCGLLFFAGSLALPTASAAEQEEEYYELLRLFVDTFEQVDRNYVKQVDKHELIEAAIRGMLLKLDPHSNYFDNDDLKDFRTTMEQKFGGIGIQVSHFDEGQRQLVISTPLPDTPAYNAGILPGDRVIEIDGLATADFPPNEGMSTAIKMMRGEPGTVVKVKLLRVGQPKPLEMELTRQMIKTLTVLGDRYNSNRRWEYFLEGEEKLALIRLTHFSEDSVNEMKQALAQIQKEGVRGLVLDLRFNPGGSLEAAIGISDLFIKDGVIVSLKGRNTDEKKYFARSEGTYADFPMAVLINHMSASASEIVSACLQDHHRAVIVGERSFGKGSVQNLIELEDGHSAIKLTTASYHRPSGKNIHRFPKATDADEWGVSPDPGFEVKLSDRELIDKYLPYRRERDVLRAEGPPKSDYRDPQLEKAVAYLREQAAAKGAGGEVKKPADGKGSDPKAANEKPAGERPQSELRLPRLKEEIRATLRLFRDIRESGLAA